MEHTENTSLTNWTICPECQGRGKKHRKLRKSVKRYYERALAQFEKSNGVGEAPVKPIGHLDKCPECSGSGLVAATNPPAADTENLPKVAIIGGGIGGVALAVACLHRGIPFTLYERDRSFDARSQGYGLTLQQASTAMEGFGITKLNEGVNSTRHLMHTTDGKVIGEWGMRKWRDANLKKNPKRINVHIARQSLRLALLEQLEGHEVVQWGHQLVDFKDQKKEGVSLTFKVDGKLEHSQADLVVGADGIRSTVRNILFGKANLPLQYLDCIVILGICPLASLKGLESTLLDSETVFQTANGFERMYMMPYSADTIMWQFSFPMPEEEAKALSAKGPKALKEEACKRAAWHDPIPQILAATQEAQISGYPVYDRALLTSEMLEENENVTLLGDAAHPMSPFKGQGANQALLDALLLARGIYSGCKKQEGWRETGIRKSVLTAFETEMLTRSAKKVKDSAAAAKFLHSKMVLDESDAPRGRLLREKKMTCKIRPKTVRLVGDKKFKQDRFMKHQKMLNYISEVLQNMPTDWLSLTTHRLDIYDEKLAKVQFLEQFEALYKANNYQNTALHDLPTAYDYIRLGHPLSCILEWGIAGISEIDALNVISFSSQTIPVLAILRKNHLEQKATQILYTESLPDFFTSETIKKVYGYTFEVKQIENIKEIPAFNGSTVFISEEEKISATDLHDQVDFYVHLYQNLGSVLLVNGKENQHYVADIQHVRRRETIAMTPINALVALRSLLSHTVIAPETENFDADKKTVLAAITTITGTTTAPLVASSGLSIQYAIMMGAIDQALEKHPGKAIKFVVPPNCYGGTNDQARRVAACVDNVSIVDLPVDGDNDMVKSIDTVLENIAKEDALAYIIAEIPTNPRVEVPDLVQLKAVLSQERTTANGTKAIAPVFILDQTFCPNVRFLGEDDILASVHTISFASGSKFPSGGQCTAGYCVGNMKTKNLMQKIARHLALCDNEATAFQYNILAKQLPSMNQRIRDAYINTLDFVKFIKEVLPAAKINFVSEALASQGFTPSVFSLDLPTKGETAEEKENYKRSLNLKLINLMITKIPSESKFCVSYGQLKGCYWTIPATSTQGTTKEGDKDYIVRASLSPNLDLALHKQVFMEFVKVYH
ncbi:monooxygenase family protein [unidentified eubacterium SCB49]|nr:monooxygenase family protein [unidentified eubacterium SCB49]